ncbi:MAG TPA: glycosyltransferase, partial [Actinotalea sp.]
VGADQRLLVTVGRLAPQKGLDLLCDAASLLGSTAPTSSTAPLAPTAPTPPLPPTAPLAPTIVWVVAGDGPLRDEVQGRVDREALPVRLLGRREDVADLMAAADVVVSTARWEGQPLGVQEALALGAAVVATDVGGTREVTGDAAVLVEPDAHALAQALASLLRDDARREQLRAVARERASQLPTIEDTMDQLTAVWGAAAGR